MPRNLPLEISNLGERLNLSCRQGSTLGPFRHEMYSPPPSGSGPEVPVDLTGCTLAGKVRSSADATGPAVAQFAFDVPAPTEGWYTFGIADDIMASLPIEGEEGRFYYDIELVDSLGRTVPLFYGNLVVRRKATRPDTEPSTDPCNC